VALGARGGPEGMAEGGGEKVWVGGALFDIPNGL